MSSKKLSLAEKYSQLINPTPFQDPEDDFIHEETAARVVDQFGEDSSEEAAEPGISDLRQKNAQVLGLIDGRYAGEKVSRRSLQDLSSGDEGVGSDDSESNFEVGDLEIDQPESENDEDVDDNSVEEDDQSDEESENETSGDEDEGDMFAAEGDDQQEEEKSFQHFSNADKGAEVDKGNAVRNQLALWDGILEFRIQLQKCLVASNQLPLAEKVNQFKSEGGKEFSSVQTKCTRKVSTLLESLLKLQGELLKKNPETKDTSSGRKFPTAAVDGNEEITSSEDDDEEEKINKKEVKQPAQKRRRLEDFSSTLTTDHNKFIGFRNATIQKWNDKTRVAQGRLNSKNFSAFEQSTVKQIEQVLADKHRLLKRTRTKRSSYRILGQLSDDVNEQQDEESAQELCSEIFDDDDFYHQLLRELIEHKSEGVTDPIQLGRQWIALQKLRSKMKRKIDTRATKGRKIRYTVQPKLVNFMAPYDKDTWTEDSKKELFHSLFAT